MLQLHHSPNPTESNRSESMAPPSRDSEPGPKPVSNNSNNATVVFIDTNLDTHLAVIVSDSDTVSDLKKRILLEHPLCFPKIGQIQIHAMKVKLKGYFYHLSDSLFVKSAFHGFNKSWFLSVDASPMAERGQNELLCSSGCANQLACLGNANNALIGPADIAINDEKEECAFVNPPVSKQTRKEDGKKLDTDVNSSGNNDIGVPLPGSIPGMQDHCDVNHELPRLQIEREVDGFSKGAKDDRNVCEEVSSISVSTAKKRRKSKREKEDTVQDNTSRERIASDDNLLSFASKEVSLNNFQVPQLENKQDEKNEIPFVSPYVSEDIGKELVKNSETGVKPSGNNDPGIPLPGSIPETRDHCCVNHELPSSHIECEVDGSSKGVDDRVGCEDGTSKSVPSAKEKRKSKRRKEDTVQYDTSKENDASVFGPGNDTVQQGIAVITNSSENADKEVIKETEVLKEHQHTECNNNHMKNDIDTESMKEASEPAHATNKKHRKRKRSLSHDSEEMLKVETLSQKVEAQKSDEACKERKESKDQFEFDNDISRNDVEYEHNKVTEVISDIKPPAKKKQKGKEKSGDKSLSKKNLSMISDFNVDNVSHQSFEVQQKIKNSSADQSAEHLNDTDPIRTSKHGGRKKGKKKSSNPHETHVPSSRKDDEADCTSIQGEVVQEETSKDGLISKDLSMSKTTGGKMEIGIDASEEGIPSKVKKRGNRKNHCDIDIKAHPSDLNEPKELTEDNVNIVLDQCHKSDANIKELNVTSKVVDMNGMAEPVKSEKKKRRTRKAKDSDGGPMLREGIGPVDAYESETVIVKSLKSTDCNPASANTGTDVNEPWELAEDNVNIVFDQCHKSEADRTEGAEEEREVLPQNDPKPTLLEECTPSKPHNTDVNIKELNATSKFVDMNGMAEPVKSEKKKRRTRKAKESDGGRMLREGIGPVDASESETVIVKSLKSTDCDPASATTGTDVNEPKELAEDNMNIFLDQCHKSEAGRNRTEGAEEEREVLPQNDPKPMLLEECTPSKPDSTDVNIEELNVTSKVVDMNEMAEPVKSEKKKRRTRKAKDSDGGPTLREGIGPIDASESETVIVESLKSTNCDPASGNTGTEDNPSNDTEGKNIQQKEMKGTVLSAIDKEDDFRADNAGSLEEIKANANAEHVDKTHRKKSNNKQISTSKSVSNMLAKGEVLDSKKPSPSSDSGAHASPSSKITKKNKSASTKSTIKSSKTSLEPVKYSVGLEPSDSRLMSGSNGSSQFPLNNPKGSNNLWPFEANDAAKDSTRSSGEKDDNNLETSLKNFKIDADQQFPSQQLQHEANTTDDILVDKMNGSDRKDLDPMTGHNAHRHEATKGQAHAESLSSSQQLSSKKERDGLKIHPDKRASNVHKTERDAKLSSQSNSNVSSIRGNRKPQVNASGKSMVFMKQREGFPISNSMLEGSKKMIQKKAGEASGNNLGGVVGKTQQKKSLLAGAIFKNDSSGTSEDVDQVDKSDASTKTPSDSSLLSDSSDGYSSAGSYGGKRLEDGERSTLKANMSSTKGMSIDSILRSSSRYKKAKITASQLEGTESQPEFVPDSLADM